MTAAGSLEAVFALQPDSKMLDNAVAARIMLQMSMYSPMKSTHRIACPLLVQIAKRDAITPSEVAAEAARRAPRCEVRQYDWSHFEPYVEPAFRIAVADQLEFLQRHVPVASASPELRPELKPRGRS
jgi:pimeloyl-ACP methyl ester carboxylesterase